MALGCGDDERLKAAVKFAPASSGTTEFGSIPFPSDLYLVDGSVGPIPGIERVLANSDAIEQGLAAMDGFGRSTGALFFVEVAVDRESLPRTWDEASAADASAFVADVDPASPHRGTRYPAYAKPLDTLGVVSVIPVPGVVLPPGVRHAVVLTDRATAGGMRLAPDEALEAIAKGARSSAAEKLYGDALDELAHAKLVRSSSEVAGLAVFTTSNRASELFELRARLGEEPDPALLLDPEATKPYGVHVFGLSTVPSLDAWLGTPDKDETGREWPGGDNPGGIAHDQIGAIATGAFVAPQLLDPETGHFEKDAAGEYVIAEPNAIIPVTLVVPKTAPPAEGYPVVVNGHGLSNNRASMLAVANELARAGFAMISIDDPKHGLRAGIADEKNNYKGSYQGPDGVPDEYPMAVSFFAGFSDFVAVRDNFRQTVLDQTSLVRLVRSKKLDLAPLAEATGGVVPKLDPSQIYWSGGSLGGIIGTMTTAVEPNIRAAALQVPGAGFVQLITTSSAKMASLVTGIGKITFGVQGEERLDEFHPLAHFLGQVTEAGDPIAYAGNILREPPPGRAPPDVMVTYAAHDEVLPNNATVALIRAIGLELAEPKLLGLPGIATTPSPVSGNVLGKTAAAVQYAPANHGLGYGRWDLREFPPGVPFEAEEAFPKLPESFMVEMAVREHAAQLAKFFSTARAGKAVIEVTAPPVADFDGDGALDASDSAPYDPKIQ